MSSAQGFPDWQRITQWLGPPIVTETGRVIGAGTITDGPYQVSNFASVIVALKAVGGAVTVTIKQTVPAGPASLILSSSVVVPAGATIFEAFVLYGGAVELDLAGAIAGTSVDYALYGSNTTTNAQVITAATVNLQHNDVLVAAEPTLDFVDATGAVWTVTDDAPGTRVKVAMPASLVREVDRSAGVAVTNSAAETAIASLIIPAGALLGNSMARAQIRGYFLNNTGAVQNYPTFKVYLNGNLYLNTGPIAGGGGVNSRAAFYGYRLDVDVESNGAANQFLNLSLLGGHAGSAVLGGDYLAGLGGWSSVAQSVLSAGRSATPAENAANPITLAVTVINAVANPQYTLASDVATLEVATH